MWLLPKRVFMRRVRRLDESAFRAFVIDLWRTRGFTVTADSDGTAVTVEPRQDPLVNRHRIVVWHHPNLFGRVTIPTVFLNKRPSFDDEIDRVVVNTRREILADHTPDGTHIIGLEELYDVVYYAVNRKQTRRLLRKHLDYHGSFETTNSWTERWQWDRSPVMTAVLVLVVGMTIAAVFLISPGGTTELTASDTDPTSRPTLAAINTPTPTDTSTTTEEETPGRPIEGVPGLSTSGITDAILLANTHSTAIGNRSYTWEVAYIERHDNGSEARAIELIRVASSTRYISTVRQDDQIGQQFLLLSNRDVYANGTYRFERIETDNETRYRRERLRDDARDRDPYRTRAARLIQWYLSVNESRIYQTVVQGNRTFYLIEGDGDPWPGVENATTEAVIGSDGIVYSLYRTHQPAGVSNRTILIAFRYEAIDNTTVDAPTWFEAARNATG